MAVVRTLAHSLAELWGLVVLLPDMSYNDYTVEAPQRFMFGPNDLRRPGKLRLQRFTHGLLPLNDSAFRITSSFDGNGWQYTASGGTPPDTSQTKL